MGTTFLHNAWRHVAVACTMACLQPAYGQSIRLTTEELKDMYSTINMQRTSVHDPSIVFDEASQSYYIFGSHNATAKTTDLQNWSPVTFTWGAVNADGTETYNVEAAEAFHVNQTKEIRIGGQTMAFGDYDASAWNCALPGTDNAPWSVYGNMWAPDIIYNPAMKKWCQYLSLNGPTWNSCIILLTADRIEGPYIYQGPVVYTGFRNDTDERISFHKTDLELVIGPQTSLPARYKQENWGTFWPHAIDPCVFYDEGGTLWMSYGSWSGGIYMLQLDEETGLRDYDITYPGDFDTKGASVTSDPYFGKKIAGGYYVSGEGSYIEHIGNHYYLFMSYGGLEPNGGYVMRVFRSENPDGPYTDTEGRSAIFTNYVLNFGPNSDTRGEILLGAYNQWGMMTVGECAQGHNSVLAAEDGNTYLVYHTKFNDGTAGHQVRVHQLYLNADGWPVAAPFEYHGEKTGDRQIASTPAFDIKDICGKYDLLIHRYGLNHADYEEAIPVEITLNENGRIEGACQGTWQTSGNNAYITLNLDGVEYKGVMTEQQMEPTTIKAICFTACAKNGTNAWGYKMESQYQLAYTINTADIPVVEGQAISRNVDLYGIDKTHRLNLEWTSDTPEIISHTGRYNPSGLSADTPVQLTVKASCGDYYWTETYHVTARAEYTPAGDWRSGIKAYYGFDQQPFMNAYDAQEEAVLLAEGNNRIPALERDSLRNGHILHQYFGASGSCSYTKIPNPLYGEELEGATVSLWVKRTDDVPWDAIWSFYNPAANTRLYLTGNSYVGFNRNGSDWFDINHPGKVLSDDMPIGEWCLVTLTFSREKGCIIYINGGRVRDTVCDGICNGTAITDERDFDHNLVLDFIQDCPDFYLGYGSFWGSVDVRMDDLIIYGRELTNSDVRALNTMSNRVTDFAPGQPGTSVRDVKQKISPTTATSPVYDLSGCQVKAQKKGHIYIRDGKKFIKK